MSLTDKELRANYETIANALADWIDQQPIHKRPDGDPTITPVYNAHVLLCELIRERFPDGYEPPAKDVA